MSTVQPITVTVPNRSAIDQGAPTIMLAGEDWPVPLLAPRQNRHVIPAIVQLMPRLSKFRRGMSAPEAMEAMKEFTGETYDLMIEVVYWSLLRAHPTFDRLQFEDMAIGTAELIAALDVIAQQTGMMVKRVGAAPGESKAGANGTSQTGTP